MPYFIYKIAGQSGEKMLEYVEEHDAFADAKSRVRAMRAALSADAGHTVRIMFAASRSEAEMQLRQKREAPILREWEK